MRCLSIVALFILSLLPGLRAQEVAPPARGSFRLYLLIGQSNMVGRDTRGIADQAPGNPRVLSLDDDGKWVVAKDPLHTRKDRIAPGVGPGLTFALGMLEADPKVTIGLIPCAVGGTPLRRWVKGGDLYKNAVARAKAAGKDGILTGVIWHQGESDSSDAESADTYGKRLAGMIGDLRKDLRQQDLPVVVGQLGDFLDLTPKKFPHAPTVRAAIAAIPGSVPHTALAEATGLGHKGDKLHFSAEASQTFGQRYAEAMLTLRKKARPSPAGR